MDPQDLEKLIKLKNNFETALKAESKTFCYDLFVAVGQCHKKNVFFKDCTKELKAADECVSERFKVLKEENKDVLEFERQFFKS